MAVQEEVDEIDAYLHLRKQRQEKGELPKPNYTPPFVTKFGSALFGKKPAPKPTLTSTQPTVASAEAQAAMRQQLKDVMDAKATPRIPSPSASVSSEGEVRMPALESKTEGPMTPLPRSSPRVEVNTPPISSGPRVPYVPPWTRATGGTRTLSRESAGMPALPRTSPSSTPSLVSRFTSFFKRRPGAEVDAHQHVLDSVMGGESSPVASSTPSPSSSTGTTRALPKPLLRAVVPLNSVARQPGYVPIESVRGASELYSLREAKQVEPVSTRPRVPAFSNETVSASRGGELKNALAETARTPANPMDAPPWVRRSNIPTTRAPAGESISEVMQRGSLKDLPWIGAKEAARNQAYEHYRLAHAKPGTPEAVPSSEKTMYPTGSTSNRFHSLAQQAGVLPTAPAEKKQSPVETISPIAAAPARTPLPARLKPWVSGEVSVNDEPPRASEPRPTIPLRGKKEAPEDTLAAARAEELSEEEALEQLPFDDVEGLSDSDIDYLEQKEKEHQAQRKKLEEDYVAPDQLKEQLQQQTIRLATLMKDEESAPRAKEPQPLPAGDEKQAILRRLKKMMEENETESQIN